MVLFLILLAQINQGSGSISWNTALPALIPPFTVVIDLSPTDQDRIYNYLNGATAAKPLNGAGKPYPFDLLKKTAPSNPNEKLVVDMYNDLLTHLQQHSFSKWTDFITAYEGELKQLDGQLPLGNPFFQGLVDFTTATLLPAPLPQGASGNITPKKSWIKRFILWLRRFF